MIPHPPINCPCTAGASAVDIPFNHPRSLAWETMTIPHGQISPSPSHTCPDGNVGTISRTTYQPIGKPFFLLDTRQWSPVHSSDVTEGGSHAPLPFHHELFALDGTVSPRMTQQADLNLDLPYSTYSCANHNARLERPTPTQTSTWVSSCSLGLSETRGNPPSDATEPSIVLSPLPESTSTGSALQHSQRSHPVYIEGLLVDKDNLYSFGGHVNGTITLYECRWETSNKPCGMWIAGSRASVSTHVRRYHGSVDEESRIRCLWDGCTTKPMLRDSIGRHVMTVHLKEVFHCQGCNQTFSRKDVYRRHVQKNEACRDMGAAMVYGAPCKVIEPHQAA